MPEKNGRYNAYSAAIREAHHGQASREQVADHSPDFDPAQTAVECSVRPPPIELAKRSAAQAHLGSLGSIQEEERTSAPSERIMSRPPMEIHSSVPRSNQKRKYDRARVLYGAQKRPTTSSGSISLSGEGLKMCLKERLKMLPRNSSNPVGLIG